MDGLLVKWTKVMINSNKNDNLPLDCWYPGGLGRYTRFKVLHPSTSNQSSVTVWQDTFNSEYMCTVVSLL